MERSTRARRRKLDTAKTDLKPPLAVLRRAGCPSSDLRLIKAMLKAGSYGKWQLFPSERGTPQGGVVSPTLSNILLTPFDREMRLRGYQLTRYADDWVITCKSAAEARAAVEAACRILKQLGVELHPQKTRIVSTAGSGDAFGRIGTGVGAMLAGNGCL